MNRSLRAAKLSYQWPAPPQFFIEKLDLLSMGTSSRKATKATKSPLITLSTVLTLLLQEVFFGIEHIGINHPGQQAQANQGWRAFGFNGECGQE